MNPPVANGGASVDVSTDSATDSLGSRPLADQHLATFGKDAAIGCFFSTGETVLPRLTPVLLRTPRGVEAGRILGSATIRQARLIGEHLRGELLRPLTDADQIVLADRAQQAANLAAAAEATSYKRSAIVLDAEVLFEGDVALLHVLHPCPEDLADWAESLGRQFGVTIRLVSLAEPMPMRADDGDHDANRDHGCGKPGCGEGTSCSSSDCSTGGCATGCGSGPIDVTAYFAEKRAAMEARREARDESRIPLV